MLISPKLLLTDPDGRNYIRYVNRRLHLWAEVAQFSSEAEANQYIQQASSEVLRDMSKAHHQKFSWNGSTWFVVFVLEYFVSKPEASIDAIEKMVDFYLKRLSSWVKYAHLVPQNQQPATSNQQPATSNQ